MKLRVYFPAILLSLALTAAIAQTPQPAKPAEDTKAAPKAAPEVPADRKAYTDANKVTDPKEKIAALEKFRKDFPDSQLAGSASTMILSTLVQKFPEDTARIQQTADKIYATADKKDKGRMAGQIASTLFGGNLLLPDAYKYAKKNLESMDQAEYLKDQKASYARRKVAVPTDEELIKRFKQSRATPLATLGRIEFKMGKTADAQKLLEESYAINSSQPLVTGVLGEIAFKSGNEAKALEYLVPTKLSGRASETASAALDTIYKKGHNGSMDGFGDYLDAEYKKRFPSPLKVEPVKTIEGRSDRLVLAEVFTGAGCPPCVGADLAFEAAMERYGTKNVAVVMYHQHIPQPDPMTNPDTAARYKFYKPLGVPTYKVDGESAMCVSDGRPEECSGGGREGAKDIYGHVQISIDRQLVTAAGAQIKLQAALSGNTVKVNAAVSGVKADPKEVNIQVLLLEKELRYSGENGIRFHPMVVRAMGGEKNDGFPMTGASASVEQSFDLDKMVPALKTYLDEYELHPTRGNPFKFIEKNYQIDKNDLAVVVFVQDTKTKKVLQSAFIDLSPASGQHTTTESSSGSK